MKKANFTVPSIPLGGTGVPSIPFELGWKSKLIFFWSFFGGTFQGRERPNNPLDLKINQKAMI